LAVARQLPSEGETAPDQQLIAAAVAGLQTGEDPGAALRLLRQVGPVEALRALKAQTGATGASNPTYPTSQSGAAQPTRPAPPAHPTLPTGLMEILNLIAVRCFENGLFDASLAYLEHALSLDNRDSDTLFNLGYVLHLLAKDDLALKFLMRIRKVDAETRNLISSVRRAARVSHGEQAAALAEEDVPSASVSTLTGPSAPEPAQAGSPARVLLPSAVPASSVAPVATAPAPSQAAPRTVTIEPGCDVRQKHKMLFGEGVVIQRDSWLNIAYDNPDVRYMIELGAGTNIGRRCTISASHRIVFGKKVLLGPNVLVTDHNHEYRHVGVPVVDQGITSTSNSVFIGDGTWIGTNSVVVGNVTVGKGCVVGADTVVTRDIPDYCVVAGSPAKVIRAFDADAGKWAAVETDEDLAGVLSRRGGLLDCIVPITDLHSLQVEVSSACNLRCPQCFSHVEGHKTGMFSRELWDTRIKPLLPKLKEIHLVGIGEPLLCKDFFYFAEDAARSGVHVHTTSNLQMATAELAERLVDVGLTTLSFSCDGVKPETYASIRAGGSFSKLQENLDLINRSKQERGLKLPQLILNFGALWRNIEELPDVVRFAAENGVSEVIAYHNVIYVEHLKDESMFHWQELSDQKFVEAKRLADRLGVSMFLPGLFSKPIKYAPQAGPYCRYPYHHLWVYSDGRVGPCCMDFPDRYVLGDIRTSTIEEVWNSAPMLRLRKEQVTAPSYTCRYCVMHGKMDLSDPRYFFRFKGSGEYLKQYVGA